VVVVPIADEHDRTLKGRVNGGHVSQTIRKDKMKNAYVTGI